MNPVRALLLPGLVLAAALLAAPARLPADPPAKDKDRPKDGPVSYYRDIRPLFQQNCQGCHQPARPLGGYVMTGHADLLKPGESGNPAVVPGDPAKSLLVDQLLPHAGKRAAMPKGKEPLPPDAVDLVRRWVAAGARDDTPAGARDLVDEGHPPVYRLPPVVSALDYSPDGSLLAVSGFHEVVLHRADGSGVAGRLVGLSERVQSLAFSPDGTHLAVAGGSPGRFGELQVWDVAKLKLKLSHPVTFDTLYGVSWSPDGTQVAFGCADNTLRAVEADTGRQVLFGGAHGDWVLGTTFSQDGAYVVSVSRDMSVKLTTVRTQRFVDNVTSITPGALKGGLQALALRPPGGPERGRLEQAVAAHALAASGAGLPRAVAAAAATGAPAPKKVPTLVTGVDGQSHVYDEVLVGGADGTPRLYKIHRVVQRVIGDDANKVRDYPALPGRLFALAFSRDGSRFAAGSSLDGAGEVRVYSTDDARLVSRAEKLPSVYTLAYRGDGRQVAAAGFDGTVRLIDPETGKVVKEFVAVPITNAAASAR